MGDYFTIVAIIKKRGTATKVEYAYVPQQWVKNGFVFWPPNNSLTLRDDPSSVPKPEWKKFKCKIKKKLHCRKRRSRTVGRGILKCFLH